LPRGKIELNFFLLFTAAILYDLWLECWVELDNFIYVKKLNFKWTNEHTTTQLTTHIKCMNNNNKMPLERMSRREKENESKNMFDMWTKMVKCNHKIYANCIKKIIFLLPSTSPTFILRFFPLCFFFTCLWVECWST
jgi:hypothetical protein